MRQEHKEALNKKGFKLLSEIIADNVGAPMSIIKLSVHKLSGQGKHEREQNEKTINSQIQKVQVFIKEVSSSCG